MLLLLKSIQLLMKLNILKLKDFQQLSILEKTKFSLVFVMFFYLRLFPKDSDEVIDYFGERTVADFSKFIDSNGKEDGKSRASDEEVNFKIV